MFLEPNEVGGPVVDLKGRVIGMNIARSGRIECFAIPAASVEKLISTAGDGKFFHPELDALIEERKGAEAAAERLKRDIEELAQRIREAEGTAPPATEEAPKEEKKDEGK
jgi:serine protease Do